MAELKKFRVREAKPRDVGLFNKLWGAFLAENEKAGAIIKGTDKNLEIYRNIFNMYIADEPEYQGVCLFIGEIAVVMAGDSGTELEFTIGRRPAQVWGIYVAPDHRQKGLGVKLHEEVFKRLKAMGFDAAWGNIADDNVFSAKAFEKAAGNMTDVPERPVYVKLSE